MSMHSRKYLRIEGDLATLVTEVTEREVALDDLLSRLAEQRSAISGMLPAGCRFWCVLAQVRVVVVDALPLHAASVAEADGAARLPSTQAT